MTPIQMTANLPAEANCFVIQHKDGRRTRLGTASRTIAFHYCRKYGDVAWGRFAHDDGKTCWVGA